MSEQPVIGHMSEVTSVSLNTANKPINRIIPELYSLLSLTVILVAPLGAERLELGPTRGYLSIIASSH